METEKILDYQEGSEETPRLFYVFQIIEYALVLLACFLFGIGSFFKGTEVFQSFAIIFFSAMPVYPLIRIYFEYKNKLITGFGIVLKIFLALVAAVVYMGLLFKTLSWPYASEMLIAGLSSLSWPYLIYAIALKNVSVPIKILLGFNGFILGVLSIGILFSLESWPNGREMLVGGFILTFISILGIAYLLSQKPTNKERYHAMNYIARSLVLLILGFVVICFSL